MITYGDIHKKKIKYAMFINKPETTFANGTTENLETERGGGSVIDETQHNSDLKMELSLGENLIPTMICGLF